MSVQLSKNELTMLKSEIEGMLHQLQEETEGEVSRTMHLHDERLCDHGEEAAAEAETRLTLVQISRHSEEIAACRAALSRIDLGGYGECQECGEEIELNRIKANPVAVTCLRCQSQLEHSERPMRMAL